MATIRRTRNVKFGPNRPSNSPNFKIDTKKITADDELVVTIKLMHDGTAGSYFFKGNDLGHLNSIHFKIRKPESIDAITWSSAQPYKSIIDKI